MPIKLKSVGGGEITIDAPNTASNYTVTLPASNATVLNSDSTLDATKLSGAVPLGSLSNTTTLTRATSVTASGTTVDFTGIPSWAKRITVMYSAISTSGTSAKLIQLGDAGGIENTGYIGSASWGSAALASGALSAGILISSGGSDTAAAVVNGHVVITNINGNDWTFSGTGAFSNLTSFMVVAGSKSLSATLDRIRFTTVNGTDTFDAGTINIMYE